MAKSNKIRMILRQLNNESTEEEKELFSNWLLSDPENLDLYIEIKKLWESSMSRDITFNAEKAERRLKQAIEKESSQVDWRKQVQRVAAVLIALVVLGTVGYYQLYSPQQLQNEQPQARLLTKFSGFGEQLRVKLPDESIVRLNAGSYVKFPEKFDGDLRRVYLCGEAFFEVTKDSLRPFQVQSDNITTTVLGTSFNIKAFGEEDITVTVATGKVKVEQSHNGEVDELLLLPNQQAKYVKSERSLKMSEVDALAYCAWTKGTIRFNNDPLNVVINTLERWYDVDIQLSRDINKSVRVNGSYTDKELYSILDGLSFIYNLKYSYVNDSTLVIDPKL